MKTSSIRRCQPAVATALRPALEFRKVTLADMPLINSLLQKSSSRTCDYSIGGLYMWVEYFKYEYCVLRDTLFIKGRTENRPDEVAFSLPVGAMPLAQAVALVKDYCRSEGIPAVFSAVPADRIEELLSVAGPDARIELLNDWADYLYDISTLATFSGKHMMKKRNHVNRFLADNPHWAFEPLTAASLPEAMAFFEGAAEGEKDDVQSMQLSLYEHDECRRVLRDLSSYPFHGTVLRGDDGRIVALSVGEVIGDTVYVHIEKMDHAVPGAGPAVCKLFAAHIRQRFPQVRFVNREEDCGDPGLRDAKLSYHPAAILEKYNVVL